MSLSLSGANPSLEIFSKSTQRPWNVSTHPTCCVLCVVLHWGWTSNWIGLNRTLSPKVFTVDQRTRAILDRDLAFEDDAVRAKTHLLAAMADMWVQQTPPYLLRWRELRVRPRSARGRRLSR